MEVPTKVSGVRPEISVLLSDSYDDEFKNFRCVVCGGIVFTYNNAGVRMILASGKPHTGRAQQVVECRNVIKLHTPEDLYSVLYRLVDAVYNQSDIEAVRELFAFEADAQKSGKNSTCYARYYVS